MHSGVCDYCTVLYCTVQVMALKMSCSCFSGISIGGLFFFFCWWMGNGNWEFMSKGKKSYYKRISQGLCKKSFHFINLFGGFFLLHSYQLLTSQKWGSFRSSDIAVFPHEKYESTRKNKKVEEKVKYNGKAEQKIVLYLSGASSFEIRVIFLPTTCCQKSWNRFDLPLVAKRCRKELNSNGSCDYHRRKQVKHAELKLVAAAESLWTLQCALLQI